MGGVCLIRNSELGNIEALCVIPHSELRIPNYFLYTSFGSKTRSPTISTPSGVTFRKKQL